MKNTKYKLKKHIPAKGYPLTDPNFDICHHYANMMEIKKYGYHQFHKINILYIKHPNQLLATHSSHGKITLASFLPKEYIQEIKDHERWELECQQRIKNNRRKYII